MKKRCNWVTEDEIYIKYHDCEWGIPTHDDKELFEMLVLESFQAGLSWITILKKRENFKKAFDDFDSNAVHNDDNYGTKNVHHYRWQDRGCHAGQ